MTHSRLVRSKLAVPVGYDPGTTHPLRPPACPAVCLSTSVCSLRRSSARLFDCLFGYLVVRPPACLPVCPVIGLSVHLAVHLYARSPVCPACLSTWVSDRPPIRSPACPPVCPTAGLFAHLSVHMPVPLPVCPPTCLYSCLFAPCLFSRVSVHQSVHLYIHIYVYMYIYIYIYIYIKRKRESEHT